MPEEEAEREGQNNNKNMKRQWKFTKWGERHKFTECNEKQGKYKENDSKAWDCSQTVWKPRLRENIECI